MSDSSAVAFLRERARKFQERREVEEGLRRMEHERLNRCYAIAALKKASYAMRWGRGTARIPGGSPLNATRPRGKSPDRCTGRDRRALVVDAICKGNP
jgi:hypothetical protein